LLVAAVQWCETQAKPALASNLFKEPKVCCYLLFSLYQKNHAVMNSSLFAIDPAE
jgi:hypothetical protein